MKTLLLTLVAVGALMDQCLGQSIITQTLYAQKDKSYLMDTTVSTFYNTEPDNLMSKPASGTRKAPWYVEKFSVSAGFFWAINNTNIKVSNTSGSIGTDLDFESDLGFKKSSQAFLGDFQWRSSSRSRFDLSYFKITRTVDKTLDKDITFKDTTFHANSNINAFFNTYIYRFSYGYAILSKPNYEFGLLVGLHIVKADAGMGVNGGAFNASVAQDFGVTAPLPDFGIWGGYTFSPRWAFTGEFGYLDVKISNIQGRIVSYNFVAMYKALDNLKFTLGYAGLNCKVDVTRTRSSGTLKWGYNGPAISAIFSFGKKSWE